MSNKALQFVSKIMDSLQNETRNVFVKYSEKLFDNENRENFNIVYQRDIGKWSVSCRFPEDGIFFQAVISEIKSRCIKLKVCQEHNGNLYNFEVFVDGETELYCDWLDFVKYLWASN